LAKEPKAVTGSERPTLSPWRDEKGIGKIGVALCMVCALGGELIDARRRCTSEDSSAIHAKLTVAQVIP
jgi:hypothetical protein